MGLFFFIDFSMQINLQWRFAHVTMQSMETPMTEIFDTHAIAMLEQLKREVALLKEQISAKEAKIVGLNTYLGSAAGMMSGAARLTPTATAELTTSTSAASSQRKPQAGSTKAMVLETAKRICNDGLVHSTKEILHAVLAGGIEIGAKDKFLAVSALLSRDPRFVSNRKEGGWSLAKNSELDESSRDSSGSV